jgi:hypothetical protein
MPRKQLECPILPENVRLSSAEKPLELIPQIPGFCGVTTSLRSFYSRRIPFRWVERSRPK